MKLFLAFIVYILALLQAHAQQHDLAYFINQAIANSPLLNDYQNQIQANHIDSLRIKAGLGPQVNAVSNNSYSPVIKGWGQDEAITNGANISALVTVSKELLGQKNIRNQYVALQLQNLSLQNAGKVSEQDLRKSVTEQYINTYGTWQQCQFNTDVLLLLQKEEQLLKKLTEQGTYKQTDYLAFLVTEQQQQWQLAQISSQYHNNYALLNYLCGIADTAATPLSDPALVPATLNEFSSSVFSRQFVIDSLKLATDNKQVDYSYQPKLNLYGDAGYNSSLTPQPAKNFGTTVGISLNVPIYDGRQRKMQHDKFAIAGQTQFYYRNFYTKQYQQQVNRLTQQLQDNRQMASLVNRQIKLAQALIDANHKLLETGDARVTDYIMAIGNYLNARNALLQNSIDGYLIINQINYWDRKW